MWLGNVVPAVPSDMTNMVFAAMNSFSSGFSGTSEKFPTTTNIINEDNFNCNLAESLGKILVKKLGKPCFCSCHLASNLSTSETVFVHKEVLKTLQQCPDKD